MATAIDIISRAQRLIGILDAGQAMQADEAQDALDTLLHLGVGDRLGIDQCHDVFGGTLPLWLGAGGNRRRR